uniref:Uncharacterized protein n=1 Tax=Sinocyclocheilus anshuiensis TaxID=1608454 RepID=A0A671K7Q7_9TELE
IAYTLKNKGLKIITVNTNGLNNPIKRKRVLQKLKRDKGEIIFLHETHLNKEEHKKLEKLGGAQVFTSSFTSAKRGVSILVKECLNFKSEFSKIDKEGRHVLSNDMQVL